MSPTRWHRASLVSASFAMVVTTAAQAPRPPASQAPAATFRSGVNYVELDASVTDEHDRFVADLTASDLQVLEDGKPRAISAFSLVDLSIRGTRTAAASADDRRVVPALPDSVSNEDVAPGRLYVIVMDDLHTSPALTTRARELARRFIEGYLGPDDLAAVLTTSPGQRATADFTSSHETLVAAIERVIGRKPPWVDSGSVFAGCFT